VAGNATQAAEAAQRALALNPGDANAHNNLGTALMQQDQLREAGECFERAVALKPDFTMAHSNLLFCLNYRPDLSAKEIFAAYRQWNATHAQALLPAAPAFANDRNPERRLRVGYVSPDFRHHAASFFMEPMLAAHDRAKFEVVCYGEVANPDATTERFRRIADRWQSTVGLSDAAVADLVREDRIDILVDLAGHTAGNRLLVLARKPAPVQVAHMVGSGMTTGIGAIDAFLADGELVPDGSEHLFAERVERLSRIPLVYAPPAAMPEVRKLPALRKGHVTFGCFSRTARVNDRVVETWARILKGVPGARLVLNSKPLREAEGRAHWHGRFRAHGVASDRIDLVYTSPQPKTWEAYAEIDIALDPFPHNAGTTTIEALWMGVPVVSLADRPPVGRFGASILGSVGLRDWVAGGVDRYVALAIGAASDRQALAQLRAALRDRFRASPLGGDAAALTREIEAVYRRLWRAYCGRT
jgi:predicted O-linked N-acetylglucosamine transferase (SPINDLY family)